MEDGNKVDFMTDMDIDQNRKAEVRLFLNEELIPLKKNREVNSYNLVTEYAKTKKNKSGFIWVLLGLCCVVVAAVTVFTAVYVSKQNKKITVDSKVFSDLDLRSMLDTQSHAEMNYLVAENTRSGLDAERSFKLRQAAVERDSKLRLLKAMRVENADKQAAAVEAAYKKQVAAIHSVYDDKLEAAAGSAAQYKQKLDSMDTSGMGTADFGQQVQQHERSLLVDTYVKTIGDLQRQLTSYQQSESMLNTALLSQLADKYYAEVDALDPVLSDQRASDIVKRTGASGTTGDNQLNLASLPQDALTAAFVARMSEVQNLFSDYTYLHTAVAAIPQKNTIAGYKMSETRLVGQMQSEFGKALSAQIPGMYATIRQLESDKADLQSERDSLLSRNKSLQTDYDTLQGEYSGVSDNISMYNSWFESMAAGEKSTGYILDISDPSAMKSFVIQSVRAELFTGSHDAVPAAVYRGKLRKITTGTIRAENGVCYFVPAEPDSAAKITAGDRLVEETK